MKKIFATLALLVLMAVNSFAAITGDFTAVGQLSSHYSIQPHETATFTLSGAFTGTVALERSQNVLSGWTTVTSTTGLVAVTSLNDTDQNYFYRLKCTAIGEAETISYSLGEATGQIAQTFYDSEGIAQLNIIDGGVTMPGTLAVTGSVSTGAVAASGQITVGSSGTGYDVIMYGDTAGKYAMYDQSEDTFVVKSALDVGTSGAAGSLDIFPATLARGKLAISVANQTGDTTVTLNANAMGQATQVNIADPGAAASYVVQTTAALALAEADVLQDVTPGTVAGSKAVVVTSDKDAGDFRNLDAVNIDAGASGTAGTVDIFPTTAARGKLTLSVADQTADTAVTLAVAGMGQATQVNIADPGAAASYVVQSTAAVTLAEADRLDGAVVANSVAAKVALLDNGGSLQNAFGKGTAEAGVNATEFGDGYHHTTYLTFADMATTVGDNASLAVAKKIYTFPAGAFIIQSAYLYVNLIATDAANKTDTPDIGLGTRAGAGAVATLDLAGTNAENLVTGQTMTDANGTYTVKTVAIATPVVVEAANTDDRYLYVNYADGWADGTDQTALLNGIVVVEWQLMKP